MPLSGEPNALHLSPPTVPFVVGFPWDRSLIKQRFLHIPALNPAPSLLSPSSAYAQLLTNKSFLFLSELVVSCEAATQTDERSEEQAVTLRRGRRSRSPRSRPRSLVDYTSYRDTKLLVASFLKQSSCSMTPEVQELVDNIRSVLQSDEEHMEEAVASANILDQVRGCHCSSASLCGLLPSGQLAMLQTTALSVLNQEGHHRIIQHRYRPFSPT